MFIYASTSSVYGGNKKMPFSENDNTDIPLQLYAATKKSNELIAHSYSHLYKLQTSGLRFFTVYGPWGRPDMALFSFVKNILQNKKIKIFNNGNHSRDFTYIDDIVYVIYKISVNHKKIYKKSKKFHQIFNIGRGKSEKLMDFINEIEKNLKIKSKKTFLPLQKGDVIKTYSNTSKLFKYSRSVITSRSFTILLSILYILICSLINSEVSTGSCPSHPPEIKSAFFVILLLILQ